MGTNFYLHKKVCDKCGRGDPPLHIGKSSGGWCFSLHVDPENGLRDLDDWYVAMEEGEIRNEYGDKLTRSEMLGVIMARFGDPRREAKWWIGYASESDFHAKNYSEPGPFGLLRHRIDGSGHCIKHGAGTWDCITGEFS